MVNVNWSIEVMHCFIQNVLCSLGGEMGHGLEDGGLGGSGGGGEGWKGSRSERVVERHRLGTRDHL